MTRSTPVILWFRNDLRLADNKALQSAISSRAPVIPLYVLDHNTPGRWSRGGASNWWLAHSLTSLAADLEARGARLVLRRGPAEDVLAELISQTKATAIYCSRCYEPWAAEQERALHARFAADGVSFKRFAGHLLREPEDVRTKANDPFKVYTPFWRALSQGFVPADPLSAPRKISVPESLPASDDLSSWRLLPTKPDWAGGLRENWRPGEAGARARLKTFVTGALATYADNRNRPGIAGTSRLSPHLAFGEITPAACWHAATHASAANRGLDKGCETFLKELAWREFSYALLHNWPTLPEAPFNASFAAFPWLVNKDHLKAWQRGLTGYPIVDAGMRELWHTGYMHNRVRMIAASFLIKHLLIPWQDGEAWFWDTLVDADLANNAASWQWVAGSGADAAPYFRIFNPILQGRKFDPDGAYVRKWVPEIAGLPDNVLHAPWEAGEHELRHANIMLGRTYPMPLVEHGAARARALRAYEAIKR